jgi:hypothetical protein
VLSDSEKIKLDHCSRECPVAQTRYTRGYASVRISVEDCEALSIAYQAAEAPNIFAVTQWFHVVAPCNMPLMFGAHLCHLKRGGS